MPHAVRAITSSSAIVRRSRTLDSFRRYVTDSPSPEKMANILRSVDTGDVAALTELQTEMESKDAHLQGVANTRRGAVTALDWDIKPAIDSGDDTTAGAVATYCRTLLRKMQPFEDTLAHLTTAIGPNVAVAELVWREAVLVDMVAVPGERLTEIPFENTGIAIRTDAVPLGLPTDYAPNKFVVYHPTPGVFPLRKTMTHATVWPYLVTHFSRTDWMAFSELYGTPIRVGEFEDDVVDADKDTLFDMLEELSSDTATMIPKGINVSLLQAAGKGETFRDSLEWAEKKVAILWLGQTLTSDTSGVGSFALGKVHDNVRTDLLLNDLRSEARMVREQILRPMVELRFPNVKAPIPVFERMLHERKDFEEAKLRSDQLRLARELRLPVNVDEAYEALGFTRPQDFKDKTIGEVVEPDGDETP